jgi:polyferredoxin
MLAARQWLPHLALAIVTVGAALVVGRVWCGWICPLGTLLGWFRFRSARRLAQRLPPRLRGFKYVLLGVIAVMAALGSLTLLVLDPIALLTRTFTTSLIPGVDYVVAARCCPCTSRTTPRASPSSSSSSPSCC